MDCSRDNAVVDVVPVHVGGKSCARSRRNYVDRAVDDRDLQHHGTEHRAGSFHGRHGPAEHRGIGHCRAALVRASIGTFHNRDHRTSDHDTSYHDTSYHDASDHSTFSGDNRAAGHHQPRDNGANHNNTHVTHQHVTHQYDILRDTYNFDDNHDSTTEDSASRKSAAT